MLEIRALGNPIIVVDGEALEPLSLRAQVLLVFLSLEGGKHSRNYLASMFWPESPEAKALTSLRVMLSELRKFLPDYLDIQRTYLELKPEQEHYLDIAEFEGLLKAGEIKKALKLYRGDLLSGVYIPGSTEFENWRRWENERIRLFAIKQAEKIILKDFGLGNYQQVENISREVIRIDPTSETANLYFILAQALKGHHSAAINHIQKYQISLRENLGMDLPGEITRIQELISKGDLDSIIETIKPSHLLPTPPTSFIGRKAEISTLAEMVSNSDCRLICIVGPGGIGKTRLAIETVKTILVDFPDGSYFVPLDSVTTGDGIIPAIADTLNFKFGTIGSDMDPQIQLFDYLRDRSLILILDGFEHLAGSGHQLSKLLTNTPKLQLIVTSRHKLKLPEEWIYTLGGLTITDSINIDDNLPDALELFLARTKQIQLKKTISSDELREASRICRLVEGMPLGIELAAAWSSVLDYSEIADEIMENYGFLEDQLLGPSSKHKSMRAVFQSSWNLLKESQQEILSRLSIFNGGFSRHAAQEISRATLTDLSVLIDRSFLRKNSSGQFEIHLIVSQFCREIISEKKLLWRDIQQNHFNYYAKFLSQRVPNLYRLDPENTRSEVQDAISNILAAARYFLEESEIPGDPNIIQDLFSYFLVRGWHEGTVVFHKLSSSIQDLNQTRKNQDVLSLARLQSQEAFFLSNLGLVEESELLSQRSLPVLEGSVYSRELAICLNNLGINAMYRGEYDRSLELLQQAIVLGQESNCYSLPSFYLWIGYVYFLWGNYNKGMESLNTSLELFSRQGNEWGKAFAYSKMGLALDGLGMFEEATKNHYLSLSIFKMMGDLAGQGYALSRMSLGALLLHDYHSALEFGLQGLDFFKEVGHRWGICASNIRIGYAKLGLGEIADAEPFLIEALDLGSHNQLEPLCLHAIGGIAVHSLLSGNIPWAEELAVHIYQHPKTPAIYKELNWIWFDRSRINHLIEDSEIDLLSLDTLVQDVIRDLKIKSPAA